MTTTTLEISPGFKLECTKYESASYATDVSFEYIEHACDHWSSNVETTVSIDKDKAMEIIAFLSSAFVTATRQKE